MRDNLSQRPRLNIPRTLPDYVGEALSVAGVFAGFLLLGLIWDALPDQIPRHFGFSGEPTAWSGRWSIVAPVIIALAMYAGLTLLNRVPHVFNYIVPITEQNAAIQYRIARSMMIWLKALIVWMFVVLVWSQARVAAGDADGINPFLIFGPIVAIHVVLGIFIYRSYKYGEGEPDEDPSAARY